MSYKRIDENKGMTLIVKTITRLTVGIILLYGIYITLHGHLSPGGGFAGGVIVALSFIHLLLAFGKEEALRRLPKAVISIFESTGALAFLTIGLLGFMGGYFFFDWFGKGEPFALFSAGMIPLANLAISVKVSFGLFGIFLVLVLVKINPKR